MDLFYKSTRNSDLKVTASQAVLTGLAPDGGLFVPSCIPCLDVPLEKLGGMTYQETAFAVMKLFFTDFTEEELLFALDYVHMKERKLYLTVNTLVKQSEIDNVYDFLLPFYRQGLDGVIVQDLVWGQ